MTQFSAGDRVRLTGAAGRGHPPVGSLGDVLLRSDPCVLVAFDDWTGGHDGCGKYKNDGAVNRLFVYPEKLDLVAGACCLDGDDESVGMFSVGHCADEDDIDFEDMLTPDEPNFTVGEVVVYDSEFHEIVAIAGYEAWLRDGGGASKVVDILDIEARADSGMNRSAA